MVRERIVDSLNFGIGQQFLVGSIVFWNLEAGRNPPRFIEVARSHAEDFGPCASLHRRDHFRDRDFRRAENSPTYLLGHRESLAQRTASMIVYLSLQSGWPQLHRISGV